MVLKEKADSESYVEFLRKKGVKVGNHVRFFSPRTTHVDVTFPWLVSIGDHVSITHGVIILIHDYSWSVIKRHEEFKGEILGAMSPVKIGNNVFIGMNAVITRGVSIGDNVIIGAGSVVTSDCEADSVYAGNPARKIMTIQQFREKRLNRQLEEAKALASEYRERYKKNPPEEVFGEYFMLFHTASEAKKNPAFYRQMCTGDNYVDSEAYMNAHAPMFPDYESFLNACYNDKHSTEQELI